MGITGEAVSGLVANVVLLCLAVLVVGLRFTARARAGSGLKLDDWTILASLICAIGIGASSIWAYAAGIKGVLFETMNLQTYQAYRKALFCDILVAHIVYGLVKLSVVLFYRRIFSVSKLFNRTANSFMVLIVAWMISAFFSLIFSARGVSGFWNNNPMMDAADDYYIIDFPSMLTAHAIIDIVLDVFILLLPMFVIRGLNLELKRKITVACIFLLGGFCLVCSIIRLYYTRSLLQYIGADGMRRLELSDNNDMWAHIEAFASVITACLPTLGPLFRNGTPLDAVFRSLRSVFTLGSRSSSIRVDSSGLSSSRKTGRAQVPVRDKRAWYELTTHRSEVSTISGRTLGDLERNSQSSGAAIL